MTRKTMIQALSESRLAWSVFLAGMVLTVLAWYVISTLEEEKARREFAVQAKDTVAAVRQRMNSYVYILHGVRGLFAASSEVTRDEWQRYTAETGLGEHHPGVHSFAFIRHVPHQEKTYFERRVRGDVSVNGRGYPGFAISPPGMREDYFPIEYIEPESRYGALLGTDRGAEPDTRKTLEQARDTGRAMASGLLLGPPDEFEKSRYFLVVMPIYRNGSKLSTILERRAALRGFVAARIEVETLIKEAVGTGGMESLFIELYDGGDADTPKAMARENLLYAADGEKSLHLGHAGASRFTQQGKIDMAGRHWLYYFGSRPGTGGAGVSLPVVVLLGGAVTSTLLFALVMMLVTQRQRVMKETVRQKSLFSQVMDALPVNIYLKDEEFRFVLVNEEMARTLGVSKESVAGKTDFDFFPQPVAARLREYDEHVRSIERLVLREECLHGGDRERCMLAGKEAIRLPGSSEPMLLGFSFDISERIHAELALRESEERLRAILDNTTSIIFLKDLQGRYLLVNNEYEKRQGFAHEQVVGNTDYELYPKELADVIHSNDQAALQAGRPLEFEEKVPSEGGLRTYIAVKFVLRNPAGEPYALAGIATDITERLRLEQAAARARANELSRSVIDALGEGVVGMDNDLLITFVNPEAEKMLGRSEAELTGKFVCQVVYGCALDERCMNGKECCLRQVAAGGESLYQEEAEFVRGDGSVFPVSFAATAMVEDRQVRGVALSFQDITRRRQVEEAVRRMERQQKAILDNLPDMAWLKDEEGRYIMVNEAVARACGEVPESLVGKSDLDLWPADIARGYRADDIDIMEKRHPKRVEEPFEDKDGKRLWIETIKSPIFDDAGKVIGTAGIARDMTERRESENLFNRHMAELARVNAELDEFTYVASHDLQEPVRKLVAFSEWLRKDLGGDLPPRAEQDLTFITDAAQRMQRLVEDLLTLSRTGKVSMVREHVALDDAVDRALDALALRIAESGATIVRTPLPKVWGDLTLLTQLYQNLISNALKFVDGRSPEISLTAEQSGGVWVFGVRDNGIGIAAQYAGQIFQPFKRLHGRSQFEGAGIGLSICRKVAERHHGRIWVESEENQGAWFKFTLGKQYGQ